MAKKKQQKKKKVSTLPLHLSLFFFVAIIIENRIDLRMHGNDFSQTKTETREGGMRKSRSRLFGTINKRLFIEEETVAGMEKMNFMMQLRDQTTILRLA